MKNKTIISIAVATMISCPAFATGIGASDTTADCDNGVLGTYTGPASLSANWNANTINLDFYDGETKLSSGTCTYDGGIELPEDPTKTGYEFDGWKVRRAAAAPSQPQQTTFDLSTLFGPNDICETTEWDSTHARWKPFVTNGYTMEDEYGTENSSDLSAGEWAVSFSYGKIKGEALCSSTNGTLAQTGTPTETGGGRYCWCKATGFAEPNSSNYQNVSSSSWVFDGAYGGAVNCAYYCASNCANRVSDDGVFRRAVFGVTGADMCQGGGYND